MVSDTPKHLTEGSGTFRKVTPVQRVCAGSLPASGCTDGPAEAGARWVLGAHFVGCGEPGFRSSLFYSCLPRQPRLPGLSL